MLIINNVVYISLFLVNIKCYLHIIFYHLSMYYSKNITERHAINKYIEEQLKKHLYIFLYKLHICAYKNI